MGIIQENTGLNYQSLPHDDKYNEQTSKRPNLQFVGTKWISRSQDKTEEDRVRLQKWIKYAADLISLNLLMLVEYLSCS